MEIKTEESQRLETKKRLSKGNTEPEWAPLVTRALLNPPKHSGLFEEVTVFSSDLLSLLVI